MMNYIRPTGPIISQPVVSAPATTNPNGGVGTGAPKTFQSQFYSKPAGPTSVPPPMETLGQETVIQQSQVLSQTPSQAASQIQSQ